MGMPNNGKIPVKIDVGLKTDEVFKQLDAIEKKIQDLDLNIKTTKGEQSLKNFSDKITALQNSINSIDGSKLTQALAPIQSIIEGLSGKNSVEAIRTLTNLSKSLDEITSGNRRSKKNPFTSIVSDYEKAIKKVTSLQKQNMSGNQTNSVTNQLRLALKEEQKLAEQYKEISKIYGESNAITKALENRKAIHKDISESTALKQIQQDLKNLDKAEKQATENAKRNAEIQYNAVKKVSDAYKEVEKNASNYYRLQAKDALGKKLTAQEQYSLRKNQALFASYENKTGVFDTSKYSSLPIDYQTRSKAALKAERDAQMSALTAEFDAYESRLQALKEKAVEFPVTSDFHKILQQADMDSLSLRGNLEGAFSSGQIKAKDFLSMLKEATKGIETLEAEAKDTGKKLASMFDVTVSQQNVESFLANNTKYLNAHRKEASELRAKANALNRQSTFSDVDAVNTLLNQRKAEANALGQNGLSFLSKMDKSIGYAVGGTVAALTTVNLAGKINETVEASNRLNASMIELSKVSDSTMNSLNAQFDDFTNISKDIGGTINDTIKATADWSRNGYSLPDSKELARVSQLYKNIGDNINIDEANTSLISTMQGYEMQASEAEHIVDVLNEVSNNEATSSAGLGEALQRSAASFEVANTSLEKSVALITAANSVVQDPSRVGNMWKTVSARIRSAKTELEDMGEDTEGMVESTAQLRDLVKAMTGFDIMKDKNTFKDIYDIVLGIGEKWGSLSDTNQAALLEKLAGKTQANALAATLNNIDTLKKAYSEAMNSQGSAMREQEHYEEGAEYHLTQMSIAWEQFSHDVVNSEVVKFFADFASATINVLNALHKLTGIAPELALIFGGLQIAKMGGLQKFYSNTRDYIEAFADLAKQGHGAEQAMVSLGATAKNVFSSISGWVTVSIAAVALARHAYEELHVTMEEMDAAASKQWDTFNDAHNKAEENAERIESIKESYASLAQGVNDHGENISLTTDEYEQYNSITNEIADMFPSLIDGWTESGNAILKHKGDIEALTQAYEDEAEAARKALISSGGNDIINDYLYHTRGEELPFNGYKFGNEGLKNITDKIVNSNSKEELVSNLYDAWFNNDYTWNNSPDEIKDLFKSVGLDGTGLDNSNLYSGAYNTNVGSREDLIKSLVNQVSWDDIDLGTVRKLAQNKSTVYASDMNQYKQQLNDYTSVLLEDSFSNDYKDISETGKKAAETFSHAFSDQWAKDAENSKNKNLAFTSYLYNAVDQIANDKDLQDAINGIMTIDTDNLSLSDVKEQTDAYVNTIAEAFGQSTDEVKKRFDVDNRDKLFNSLTDITDKGASKFSGATSGDTYDQMAKEINEFINKNSVNNQDELALLNDWIAKSDNWHDALEGYKNEVSNSNSDDKNSVAHYAEEVTTYTEKAKSFANASKTVSSALSEQANKGVLSADSVKSLLSSMNGAEDTLIRTSEGIKVNTDALNQLVHTRANEAIEKLGDDYTEMTDKYSDNMDRLSDLYSSLSYASGDYADQIRENISAIEDENNALVQHMSEVQSLQDVYKSITNAYNEFQNAVSSPNSGTRYDFVQGQKKNIEKEVKAGWVGNDEVRQYVNMFTNKDMTTASIDEISASWDHAKKFADTYFTESTKGVTNFYNKVSELADQGVDGLSKTSKGIEVNADKLAEVLDVDVSTVHLLMEKLQETGANVTFDEATVEAMNFNEQLTAAGTQLKALNDDLEKLKGLKDGYTGELNLKSTDIPVTITSKDDVTKKIEEIQELINHLNSNIVLTADVKQAAEEVQKLQEQIDKAGKDSNSIDFKVVRGKQEEIAKKAGTTVEALLKIDTSKAEESITAVKSHVKEDQTFKLNADTKAATSAIDEFLKTIPDHKDIKINLIKPGADLVASILSTSTEDSKKSSDSSRGQKTTTNGKRASAEGSSGIESNGKSLVGEQGQELLVRDGKYQTVGNNGAEMIDVKKGDIIFTATQTKDLLEKGKINGRGDTVGGEAFAEGNIDVSAPKTLFGSEKIGFEAVKAEKAKTKESKKQAKHEKAKTSETKKQYDWVDKAKTIIGQKISDLEREAKDERKTLSDRISAYDKIKKLDEERIEINQKALDRYKEGWEDAKDKIKEVFGTDTTSAEEYIRKIENGDVEKDTWKDTIYQDADKNEILTDAEKLTYSKITTAIDDGITAFNNMLTAHSSLVDAEDNATAHVKEAYQAQLDANQAYIDKIDTHISQLQSNVNIKKTSGRGYVSQRDYANQISATEDKIAALNSRRAILEEQMADADVGGENGSSSMSSLSSAISDIDKEISSLRENITELNETIKEIPIQNIENYRENISTISSDFSNLRAEQEALGKTIDSKVIGSETKVNAVLAEQAERQRELIKDRMKTYDVGTDKWNEMYKQLQQMDDAISSVVQNMIDLQKQLLQLPLEGLENVANQLSAITDSLSSIKSDNEVIINFAQTSIQRVVDKNNDKIEDIKDNTEKVTKPMQEQLDILQKQNDARKRQLEVDEARYNLEKAKEESTVKVIRNGKIAYDADEDVFREAKNALDEAEYSKTTGDLQAQIDEINDKANKQTDAIEKENKELQKRSKKWSQISSDTEYDIAKEQYHNITGGNADEFAKRVVNGTDDDIYNTTKKNYRDNAFESERVKSTSEDIAYYKSALEILNQRLTKGEISQTEFERLLTQLDKDSKDGFSSQEKLKDNLAIYGQTSVDSAVNNAKKTIGDVDKTYTDKILSEWSQLDKQIDRFALNSDDVVKTSKDSLDELKRVYNKVVDMTENVGRIASRMYSSHSSDSGHFSPGVTSHNIEGYDTPVTGVIHNANSSDGSSSWHSDRSSPSSSSSGPSGTHKDWGFNRGIEKGAVKRFATGILQGAIAETDDDRVKLLQKMATSKMSPTEVPAFLDIGEVVLNPRQQTQLLSNIRDGFAVASVNAQNRPMQAPVVNITLGDLNLPNVKDGNGFADALVQQLEPTMNQQFTRIFKR